LPTKRLTEEVRRELKKPLGLLLTDKEKPHTEQLKQILKEHRAARVIVVGDFTAMRFLESGLEADVYILDNRIMRRPIRPLALDLRQTIQARNPAGKITEEAWRAVRQAIQSGKRTKLIIDGEEDLLTLPAILFSPIGSLVLYGQPEKGLVAVEVTKEKKGEITRIVERMRED